jgi:uncharacterized protein (TIGR02001 family)
MKFFIKPLAASCAALMLSTVAAVPAAHAELTAAAGVATSYYWRGLQVSNGAQVWGEATYTLDSGFYGDIWASSEGFGVGPEYDISLGWAGKLGGLGVNAGVVTYVYSKDNSEQGAFDDNDPGDFSDAYIKLSYGDAFGGVYYNIAQAQSQMWVYAGYTIGKFTGSIGYQEFKDTTQINPLLNGDEVALDELKHELLGSALTVDPVYGSDKKWNYTYVDVTFAATKNLSLIVSSVIDHSGSDQGSFGVPANLDTNRAKVVAAYSLPIDM